MNRLFLIGLLAQGCAKKEPPLEPVAYQRLREHIVSTGRQVAIEEMGEERLWTDTALLERGRTFPPSIEAMLTVVPRKPLAEHAQAEMLQNLDRTRADWVPAQIRRDGTKDLDCHAESGAVSAHLNCVYVNYLEARSPRGRFMVKGTFEPVLFVEHDTVRAAVMPLKD